MIRAFGAEMLLVPLPSAIIQETRFSGPNRRATLFGEIRLCEGHKSSKTRRIAFRSETRPPWPETLSPVSR